MTSVDEITNGIKVMRMAALAILMRYNNYNASSEDISFNNITIPWINILKSRNYNISVEELFSNRTIALEVLREIAFGKQDDDYYMNRPEDDYLAKMPALRVFFYCLYALIFVIGILGNALVCYVVFRNKSMQNVTNLFITDLALSDILLCAFAVPFTPLYLLTFRVWVFGRILCHLVPYAQGVSVYISAFTLMAIAIDRFFVIIYPFKPRMEIRVCYLIIVLIWISAALLTLPYGLFMQLQQLDGEHLFCDEQWPHEESRRAFGFSTSVLQFVIPFTIICICYIPVCLRLRNRARTMPGAKSLEKERLERERTKRTNRMLISMVIIFGISWMPLNIHNLVQDFYIPAAYWPHTKAFFLLAHAIAMSSTCYNPFLYAWLNENFKKEFKAVLPCFSSSFLLATSSVKRDDNKLEQDKCNGNEQLQEAFIPRNNSNREMMALDVIPQSQQQVQQQQQQSLLADEMSKEGYKDSHADQIFASDTWI